MFFYPFLALKQNLGDHRFKDDREVEINMFWWLIAQDTY